MNNLLRIVLVLITGYMAACGSPSNQRGITVEELEKVQSDALKTAAAVPAREALSAVELIELSNCSDADCVQFFMKDRSHDFVHAKKGEYATLRRSSITDTLGNLLLMPLSTLYVDINPGAGWRLAHTLHNNDFSTRLLKEFQDLGFSVIDSAYNRSMKNKRQHFISRDYPNVDLYLTMTYNPWNWKGLYKKVTWPCYVFEVYKKIGE